MDHLDARTVLEGLAGQTIKTLSGRPNSIIHVGPRAVLVATGKSPQGKPVPIVEVQSALDRLVADGEVEISVPSVGYRSAFIGAVLATIPGTVATMNPRRIRLGAGS